MTENEDRVRQEAKDSKGTAQSSGRGAKATSLYAERDVIYHEGSDLRPPLQRPPRAEYFANREKELKQLLTDLQPGQVVTLCGPGGIGKSALASEVVWILTSDDEPPKRFSDGIIFHSFYNQPQADLALESIALAFGEEPKPTPIAAAQRALAGKRVLLLLDGTEDADNLPVVQQVTSSCGVLITSRSRKDAANPATRQDIGPLDQDEAVKLLQAWGGKFAADELAVRKICELVAGLPLAVRLVGFYLSEQEESAADYLEWLAETPIAALSQGEHKDDSIKLLLERSLSQVSETSRDLLAVIGFLALAPFEIQVVAKAMGLGFRPTRQLIGELISYGILFREGERYRVSHALIHTYASRRLRAEVEAIGRLVNYYTNLARVESEKGLAGYQRLDGERVHLMRLLRRCANERKWVSAQDLVLVLYDYLNMQGHWTEKRIALEIGLAAAQASDDRDNEITFLYYLGIAYRDLGQVEQAIGCYEQSLVITQEMGDRREEGNLLGKLGQVYSDLGEVEQGIGYFEQALAIAQETGNRQAEGNHLADLGVTYSVLGEMEKGIDYFEQALVIAQEMGDRREEGSRLGNLGMVYLDLGQIEQAIGYFEQALAIAQEIGFRQGEGNHSGNLGSVYYSLGQVEQAIGYFEQALAIAQEIGHRQNKGDWLSYLGLAYRDLGEIEKGIGYFEQALVTAQGISYRRGESTHLSNLGSAYYSLGQVEKAIGYFEQALAIAQEIGFRQGEGNILGNLGNTYYSSGQAEQAIEYYEQALVISQEMGNRREEGNHLGNLGNAYRDLEQVGKARDYLEQALRIFEEIKSPNADLFRKWLNELSEE